MHWIQSHRLILILLLATVLLRLPSLNRPLSKHHEFNTAVTLINAESWQQAGGGQHFNYTPLMNYQGYANKLWENGPHVDSAHHHLYLSFGAGAFVLPYFFFQIFHLPFHVVWLQVLNIIFSLWGIWLLYGLMQCVTNRKELAFATALIYALLPSVLWYTGNGYVNTAIMLPFIILILKQWQLIEKEGKLSGKQFTMLFVLFIVLTWFDWFAVFLAGSMALWAMVKRKRIDKPFLLVLVLALSAGAGVFLVLFQFASYFGWDHVLEYWKSRFMERSTDTSHFSWVQMILMVGRNLFSGYLPIVLLLPFLFSKQAFSGKKAISWPIWALIAIVPYNGLFFNWSAEHEFAWLAFGLTGTICIGTYVLPNFRQQVTRWILFACVVVSVSIYYFINRPGEKSWRGDDYAAQMKLGHWIKANVDGAVPIFSNIANDKITEFYSKRTVNTAVDMQRAMQVCQQFGVKKATWLFIDHYQVKRQVIMLIN